MSLEARINLKDHNSHFVIFGAVEEIMHEVDSNIFLSLNLSYAEGLDIILPKNLHYHNV